MKWILSEAMDGYAYGITLINEAVVEIVAVACVAMHDGRPMYQRAGATDGLDMVYDPAEAEVEVKAEIKFDGCGHWYFAPGNEGYLHLCGLNGVVSHIGALGEIMSIACIMLHRENDPDWSFSNAAERATKSSSPLLLQAMTLRVLLEQSMTS